MSADAWYYARDGETVGPMSRAALLESLAGVDGPQTMVYGPGSGEWRRARDVPGLLPTAAPVQVAMAAPAAAQPHAAHAAPGTIGWLPDLMFRPRRFFQQRFAATSAATFGLAGLLYGISSAAERIDTRYVLPGQGPVAHSWSVYWLAVVLAGVLGAILYWWIGGWWYGVRLAWCGATLDDKSRHRQLYLISAFPVTLTSVLLLLAETALYETPLATWSNAGPAWLGFAQMGGIVILLPWTCWISYRGTRVLFDARRAPALIWFLGLPVACYVVAISAAVAVGAAGLLARPADVDNPRAHQAAAFTVRYPGNWFVDDEGCSGGADEVCDLWIEPMQDASWHCTVYWSEQTLEAELDATFDMLVGVGYGLTETGRFERYGGLSGTGRNYDAEFEGVPCEVRTFVTGDEMGRRIEMQEFFRRKDRDGVVRGFGLIERSFELRD